MSSSVPPWAKMGSYPPPPPPSAAAQALHMQVVAEAAVRARVWKFVYVCYLLLCACVYVYYLLLCACVYVYLLLCVCLCRCTL